MSDIVLASGNAGKIAEFIELFRETQANIVPQSEYNVDEVEETALTFVENAIHKARHAAQVTGFSAIADDSGLEVDALEGAPGVYSARYAGEGATNRERMNKLMQALQEVPPEARTARYQSVVVYLRHAADPSPVICQGTWEGQIAQVPKGEGGFGYDPVFYLPTHECTAAELSLAEKNKLSHRGQAMQMLLHCARMRTVFGQR